jgi:chromate transporter
VPKVLEIFFIFLRLGLTSFGGPIAHLSYFHNEFVLRRKWFDEHQYADLVALCQFLPGPASSQVGIAIGLSRAGVLGAIAAWTGFTLPSALLLVGFAFGIANFGNQISSGWLHGLKVVAVAIVAQAIWGMGAKLCSEKKRATIAVLATVAAVVFPFALGQVAIIAFGGIAGWLLLKESTTLPHEPIRTPMGQRAGGLILACFLALLIILPVTASRSDSQSLKMFDSFFRAGSLVFGGGHVVLPLLKAEVVNPGWVTSDAFMAGYGAAQAVPGPLFTFSAYLGAISKIPPAGWLGAFICLIAVFLPSFLLIMGALPFWEKLRRVEAMRFAMQGINAAVVGLLLSAFYNPVWTSAILAPKDFAVAAVCFLLLVFWKAPSWSVVVFSAIVGGLWL